MESESFGTRLKWVRKSNHLTLAAFAAKCGFHNSYLSMLERGKAKNPSIDFIEKVSKIFGVSRAWLETGEGQPSTAHVESLHTQATDFPAIIGLTDEQLNEVIEHFKKQTKIKPDYLALVYKQFTERLVIELLRRLREPNS